MEKDKIESEIADFIEKLQKFAKTQPKAKPVGKKPVGKEAVEPEPEQKVDEGAEKVEPPGLMSPATTFLDGLKQLVPLLAETTTGGVPECVIISKNSKGEFQFDIPGPPHLSMPVPLPVSKLKPTAIEPPEPKPLKVVLSLDAEFNSVLLELVTLNQALLEAFEELGSKQKLINIEYLGLKKEVKCQKKKTKKKSTKKS